MLKPKASHRIPVKSPRLDQCSCWTGWCPDVQPAEQSWLPDWEQELQLPVPGWAVNTLLPGAERSRDGAECPDSSSVLTHKRWGCFTPLKTHQHHASSCTISSFGKAHSNPLQLPKWKWDNLKSNVRFQGKHLVWKLFSSFLCPLCFTRSFRPQFEDDA